MKKQTVTSVVDYFGGEGPFSIMMNVSREAIKRWQRKKAFPADQAHWVEILSNGKISRHSLPVEDWQKPYLEEGYGISAGQLLDRSKRLQRSAELLAGVAKTVHDRFNASPV